MKKLIKTMLIQVSIGLGIILIFIMITSSNVALKKPLTTQENIPSQPQKIYSGSGLSFISSFKELKIVENGIIPASPQNPQVAITRTTYKGKAEIILSTAYSNQNLTSNILVIKQILVRLSSLLKRITFLMPK